jgi:dTDP-4-dehydrorhamnose 3,5-epimerase
MNVLRTEFPDLRLIEPKLIQDNRGWFMETFHGPRLAAAGIDIEFVQDNHSLSHRGVLRGLHYQIVRPQGKLVRVVRGEIYDVAVDLRRNSPSFGKWFGTQLSCENRRQLYIPCGFAHGFLAVSEVVEVLYKCTDTYSPEHERTLVWDDPEIGIQWPTRGPVILSEKDRAGKRLADSECYA